MTLEALRHYLPDWLALFIFCRYSAARIILAAGRETKLPKIYLYPFLIFETLRITPRVKIRVTLRSNP